VFDRQSESYKVQVLPRNVPRVAVEAGVSDFWWKYGVSAVVGLDRFGESAPAPDLFKFFKITADNVVAVARKVVGK
jgi:transketolase